MASMMRVKWWKLTRVDSMIAELGKLRAEVGQLEKLRDVLKAINE